MSGRLRHGHTAAGAVSKEYRAWTNMKSRCGNPKDPKFKNYGARGVSVCERWSKFEGFIEDMGSCPAGMTLDRINNDDGYHPENCRWISNTDQQRNKRNSKATAAIVAKIRASTLSNRAAAKHFGMSHANVWAIRNNRSWRLEE